MKFIVEDWLAASSVRWPDENVGPWEITLDWRAAADRAECAGIHVVAVDDDGAAPVTASLMRSLPVAQLISTARRHRYEEEGGSLLEALADGQEIDISQGMVEQYEASASPWSEQRAGRPRVLGHEFYTEVASVYSQSLAGGGNPLLAIQNHWTTSRPTASRWVAAARAEGLLPPTERGRARGNDLNLTSNTDMKAKR